MSDFPQAAIVYEKFMYIIQTRDCPERKCPAFTTTLFLTAKKPSLGRLHLPTPVASEENGFAMIDSH